MMSDDIPFPEDPAMQERFPYLKGLNPSQLEAVEALDGLFWCWRARGRAKRAF